MRREVLAQWAGKLTASLRQHRAVWLVLLAGLVLLAVPTGERLSADRAEPTPVGCRGSCPGSTGRGRSRWS